MNKEDSFKEKLKQALISTVKVISDDYEIEKKRTKTLVQKTITFLNLII